LSRRRFVLTFSHILAPGDGSVLYIASCYPYVEPWPCGLRSLFAGSLASSDAVVFEEYTCLSLPTPLLLPRYTYTQLQQDLAGVTCAAGVTMSREQVVCKPFAANMAQRLSHPQQ
jgi:hypothetical protein